MRYGLLAGVAIAAMAAVVPAMHASNAVPDWVKAATAQPLPSLPSST